ncbi:MAG: hypothetical protein KUG69_10345 [Marinosulfonomonas sp.]|nr:hypothetical protein [Marinosulfonomonas sp.]
MDNIAARIFQIFSWATTGIGLFPLLHGQMSVWLGTGLVPLIAAITLTTLMTTAIQVGLTSAWNRFFRMPVFSAPAISLVAFVVAAGLSLASGIFASGSWTALLDATGVRDRTTAVRRGTTIDPLRDFARTYATLAEKTNRLSSIAERKRDIEDRTGGSCDGETNAVRGFGPKATIRNQQARVFGNTSSQTRTLSQRATEIAITVATATDDVAVIEAYKEASRLALDPVLSNLRATVHEQLDGIRNGFTLPDTSAKVICKDANLEAALVDLQTVLDRELSLPNAIPTSSDITIVDSLNVAWEHMGRILQATLDGQPAEVVSSTVLMALILAGAIELFIIAFLSFEASTRRARGIDPSGIDVFLSGARKLGSAEKEKLARQFFVLQSLAIYDDDGRTYFAVPLDGNMSSAAEAEQIALCWQLRPDRRLGAGVDLSRVEPGWVIARDNYHGGARHFRLYGISKRAIRHHLRHLARDVGHL